MSQYVGKTISLVNKADVRYVGTLAMVSAETSSLVLKDVLDYGTETRVSGAGSIPGSTAVLNEMTFLGSDVADLQVLDGEAPNKTLSDQSSSHPSSPANATEDADDAFFYAQTQKFAESGLHDAKEETTNDKPSQDSPSYNKSASFFDNFSTPDRTNEDAYVQHNAMNAATFGEDAAKQLSRDRTRSNRGNHRGNRGGRSNSRGGFRGNSRGERGGHRGNSANESEPSYYYDKEQRVFRDQSTKEVFDPEHTSYQTEPRRGGRGGRGRGSFRGGRGAGRGGRGRGRSSSSEHTEFVPSEFN